MRYDMEKYDDRLDGFNQNEYDVLATAYISENGNLDSLIQTRNDGAKIFGENGGVEAMPINDRQTQQGVEIVQKQLQEEQTKVEDSFVIDPTPQIAYRGLNSYEISTLNDLVLDLRQYFKDDFGLAEFLPQIFPIDRPILYFVNRNKMLSKLVAVLCSIFDKSRLSKELHSLVAKLIVVARAINNV